MPLYEELIARELIPDCVLRPAIRHLNARKLRVEALGGKAVQRRRLEDLLEELRSSPIALNTQEANTQHYEVPPAFYEKVLGKRLKYSGGLWPEGVDTLDESEEKMLALTAERAELTNGQQVLELGCGWGSLTLYVAGRFPESTVVGVSNSRYQKAYIEEKAERLGLGNVQVICADMNEFGTQERFDRVLSVEMFEHMRNYQELLARISGWLKPNGKLFVHMFTHRSFAYPFVDEGASDWMAREFFTGGLMPSEDLLSYFQKDLKLQRQWRVSGTHYHRTCEAWLKNQDKNRKEILEIFAKTYGPEEARKRFSFWRVFFMACAELFGHAGGREWGVSHYLFEKHGTQEEGSDASRIK
ncbi:MAG: class I SAM-dependent methyltransferase [Candidatus Omnitrophica bacterium]|nr:class I SAM-dependent methyltransferase [Candidatus Omnitrophota bacterium]